MAGSISGSGLASAKTIEPAAIEATSASFNTLGALTPIKISAPAIASWIEPLKLSLLEFSINQSRIASSDLESFEITPSLSKAMMLVAPLRTRRRAIAVPAAPAPLMMIFTFEISFLTSLSALRSAALTTMAVPCWSSWNTGISRSSRRRRSTSKQRGAEISSRLMPP